MFTAQSIDEVKAAFDHHAIRQKILPGGLGMGELEIEVLATMVTDFAGNDAYGSTIESLESQLLENENGIANHYDVFVNFKLNDKVFKLNIVEITDDEIEDGISDGLPGWKVIIRSPDLPIGLNILKVWGGTPTSAVKSAFDAMQENEVCQACGNLLQCGYRSYCEFCSRHWNDKGCITCLGKVGKLEDGEHQACKRRRIGE
jgi:hypothetical protein